MANTWVFCVDHGYILVPNGIDHPARQFGEDHLIIGSVENPQGCIGGVQGTESGIAATTDRKSGSKELWLTCQQLKAAHGSHGKTAKVKAAAVYGLVGQQLVQQLHDHAQRGTGLLMKRKAELPLAIDLPGFNSRPIIIGSTLREYYDGRKSTPDQCVGKQAGTVGQLGLVILAAFPGSVQK